MKTHLITPVVKISMKAFAFVMLLVFGLGGNAQTNFQSTNGNSRMKVLYVTFVDFFPMVTPEGKVLKVGKLRTDVFLPTDPEYSHWDAIRKGDPPTREVTEVYVVDGETYFDITWFGPHPEDAKTAIRAGVDHAVEDFAIANSANHANIDIVSTGLGSALAVTVVDWIIGDLGLGSTWYPAFLIENLPGGSNANGNDFDFEISWNWLFYGAGQWSLLIDGTYVPNTYSLMYVIMHEMLTGMGFSSSADKVGSLYSLGWSGSPAIFDRYLIDGSGALVWGNPDYSSSSELGGYFTSDSAYFLANYESFWAKLYAESTYAQGTSISRLDEKYWGQNELMTAYYTVTDTIPLDVGWIGKRVLETLGWVLDTPLVIPVSSFTGNPTTITVGESVTFTNTSSDGVESEWWFESGNPDTVQTYMDPVVVTYTTAGTWDVTLIVHSDDGVDTLVMVDYITVNAVASPTITLQPQPTTGCEGDSLALQVSATGTPPLTYQWFKDNVSVAGETDTIIVFNPSVLADVGDYFCRVTNAGGDTDSDTVAVTVNFIPATPTISASGDTTFCDGGSVDLSVDTPESGVTYTWSNGETGNTITVTLSGSYSCYGENDNGGCTGASSNVISVTVNFIPATPTISASGDTTFCNGGSVDLSVDTPESGVTYHWSNGETGNTITVTLSGSYSCYGVNDNGGCTGGSSNVISVTVWETPTANAGADQSIPYNTSTFLDGSASGGDGSYVYSWTPVSLVVDPADPQTETVDLTAPTTFWLDVTDGNGCAGNTDDVFIDVTGGPLGINPTVTPEATCGDTEVQLFANAYGGSENYTYSWTSDPVGFTSTEANPTDTPSETTTYICEVDDGNATETGEVTVTVYSHVVANAGPDMGLELGQSAEFEGSYSGGSGDVSIWWEGVNNTIPLDDPTVPNPIAGPFTEIDIFHFMLTVTDNITGCESMDTMFVDVILGISEEDVSNIKIYPNPTSGNIFIDATERPEIISIANMTGSEIIYLENTENMTQIDLSSLPSGMYFIGIRFKSAYVIRKIYIQ